MSDEDVVLLERVESSVVSTQKDAIVTVVVTEPTVVTDEMRSYVTTEHTDTQVVAAGQQGPQGPGGPQGPAGSGGDLSYSHTQGVASDTWVINHNLNKYPSVVVVDSGGSEVIGNVDYTSLNIVTLSFSASFSGSAHLN